jgi:small subunit ribosomal protein S17
MSAQDQTTAPAATSSASTPDRTEGMKTVTGIVTSDKMQKTRSVQVMRMERHPKYGKYLRRHTTYKVHDEQEASHVGDTVLIAETRPLSKTKRWRLVEVVTRSRLAGVPLAELAGDAEARRQTPSEGGQES